MTEKDNAGAGAAQDETAQSQGAAQVDPNAGGPANLASDDQKQDGADAQVDEAGTGTVGNGGARDGTAGDDQQSGDGEEGQGQGDQPAAGALADTRSDDGETNDDEPPASHATDQIDKVMDLNQQISDGVIDKIEELAEHAYLTAEQEIAALVEEVESLARAVGVEISKLAAYSIATSALITHKLKDGHVAVKPL